MRRLSISLAITTTIAAMALPANAMFLQVDPVGYADQMNLYAYVHNDPLNMTDPTGLASVCTQGTTGSRARISCVKVDGNGDGNVDDDDLTGDQIDAFASDFSAFIHNNNGRDISGFGLAVDDSRNLLGADDENALRATTQFVGASLSNSQYQAAWKNVSGIAVTTHYKGQRLGSAAFTSADQEGYIGTDYIAWPNVFPISGVDNIHSSPSNLARIILHEFGHSSWVLGYSPTRRHHQSVDAWARGQLSAGGLAGGGCARTNGFPGC